MSARVAFWIDPAVLGDDCAALWPFDAPVALPYLADASPIEAGRGLLRPRLATADADGQRSCGQNDGCPLHTGIGAAHRSGVKLGEPAGFSIPASAI